ncbi:hypothetical protein [Acinetobacter oleivorans]|jgi:hypothetical protein|uniref:hypothetical protein n=1 Tax=Acinetobacter TaxID=469 RepID=UPI00125F1FC6|nr:hypothetical protein [Acinetobacter oleivorans]
MNNHSDYTFSLYVSGINLKEINPLESAKLLEALCKMLGAKHLKWGDIKEGSADYAVKVDPEYFDEKVDNFNKAVSEKTGPIKTIDEFLSKHPKACTVLRYKESSNQEYIELHKFQKKDDGFVFFQEETLRCRVIGLHEGTDKTDHIYVQTISGKKVSVALSPHIAATLGSKYRTQHQIEIFGKAKYRYISYNDVELLSFVAENIEEVPEGSLSSWIEDFKNAGDSGWNQFEDPIAEWLKERHE